jgi:uncharacterized protein (DUF362 family)
MPSKKLNDSQPRGKRAPVSGKSAQQKEGSVAAEESGKSEGIASKSAAPEITNDSTTAKKKIAPKTRSKKATAKKQLAEGDSLKIIIDSGTTTARRAHDGKATRGALRKTRAVIVQERGTDKFRLLESALNEAGLWQSLEAARQNASLAQDDFRILIKPDLALFDQGGTTGTDPELVEHLIDLLHERGYSEVTVGEGQNSFDLWLENRDVLVLADMVGYKFVTERGHSYDIVDLGNDIIEVPYPKGSTLYGTGLARPWVEAHYRISFAKNKTDEENFYALGLQNMMGVLPLRDKDYHYHHRLRPWDVCLDLLRQTPVHFGIIDAIVSNHGSAGSRVPRPLVTETIIASRDLLLADWAAATKMGLDPHASQLNARAFREIGLPVAYEVVGALTPYEGWANVHPLVADSVRKRNEWTSLSRAIKPWLQPVNRELFPFKDAVNERVNVVASRYFSQLDEKSDTFWTTIGLNYWLGAVHKSLEAWRTLYRKDSLRWIEAPLNLDLSFYSLSDYEEIVAYLEPLAESIRHIAPDGNGLRWRYLDGSVLFDFSRVIPAPYDDFVARVDISRAIEFMNDYIGGVAVPLAHDERERVTHQAERNLYLTQPNYLVLYEGKVIDVTKLEFITYTEDEQKIYWKTVKSENDSATFDDGIVTFARTAEGEILVTVFGRQQFTLPLFWQAVNLDLNPLLKDFLVTHAYTTFFTQTLANFEAKYEGRDIRIGRPWNPLENEPDVEASGKTPTEWLMEFVGKANKVGEIVNQHYGGLFKKSRGKSQPKNSDTLTDVDEDGFLHFKPGAGPDGERAAEQTQTKRPDVRGILKKAGAAARNLLNDLGEAAQKDWGTYHEDD